jgi:hypothetical protein
MAVTKTPQEVVEHVFDFSEFNAAGEIESYSLTASQPGLTLVKATLIAGLLTVWVGGGQPDWNYGLGALAKRPTPGLSKDIRVEVECRGQVWTEIGVGVPELPTTPSGALMLGGLPIMLDGDFIVFDTATQDVFPPGSVMVDGNAILLDGDNVTLA